MPHLNFAFDFQELVHGIIPSFINYNSFLLQLISTQFDKICVKFLLKKMNLKLALLTFFAFACFLMANSLANRLILILSLSSIRITSISTSSIWEISFLRTSSKLTGLYPICSEIFS